MSASRGPMISVSSPKHDDFAVKSDDFVLKNDDLPGGFMPACDYGTTFGDGQTCASDFRLV